VCRLGWARGGGAAGGTRSLGWRGCAVKEVPTVGVQVLVGELLNETIGSIIGVAHASLVGGLRRLQCLLLCILLLLGILLSLRSIAIVHEISRSIGGIGRIDVALGPLSLVDRLGKRGGGSGIGVVVGGIVVRIIPEIHIQAIRIVGVIGMVRMVRIHDGLSAPDSGW